MPRGGQVGRWLQLLQELSESRRGLSAEILARRHGWHVRTVHRDLAALDHAGVPLASDGGRWKLVDGWKHTLPFPMPVGEKLALHAARLLMRPYAGTPFARDFGRLYDRLGGPHAAAPDRQGALFQRLRPVLTAPSELAIDYGRFAGLVETLATACEQRQTVRAVYFVDARRELTRRDLDPYHLHFDPRLEALYVFAWCHLRGAMRTFAMHRFRAATPTARRFEVPATFSVDKYLGGSFRIWRGENTVRVRLGIDSADAGWVSERRWHASQRLRRRADGGCELDFTVDSTVEIRRFILQFGSACQVLAPARLRREIADEHARAARRAAAPPQESMTLEKSVSKS